MRLIVIKTKISDSLKIIIRLAEYSDRYYVIRARLPGHLFDPAIYFTKALLDLSNKAPDMVCFFSVKIKHIIENWKMIHCSWFAVYTTSVCMMNM